VRILSDGGITKSGDIVKALTLSDAVICGGVLAGCREAPGEIMEIGGKVYKQYRGMGSLAAMKAGSAARYGRDRDDTRKVAAEGIEALKEVSGSVDEVLTNLISGVQSGMGYLGAKNLGAAPEGAICRVSPAGQKEAAPTTWSRFHPRKLGPRGHGQLRLALRPRLTISIPCSRGP
jgi:IMP dehydrogenase